MDERDRTPEEWEDAFEASVDDEGQNPMKFYFHVEPISPEEDVEAVPTCASLQEAIDARKTVSFFEVNPYFEDRANRQ